MGDTNGKVFDLDQVRKRAAGRIRVAGVEHDVLQITGGTYQSIKTAEASNSVERMIEAVRKCVPTLSDEELRELTLAQMETVVTIAGSGLSAIEALYPNSSSPEAAPASTSPG